MDDSKAYSTSEVERYLEISHAATLSRLNNLAKLQLVSRRMLQHKHYWAKVKHTGDTL